MEDNKQFQYQKEAYYVNKRKRSLYEAGITKVHKRAKDSRGNPNRRLGSSSRSRSSTKKPLKSIKTANENIQEHIVNKVATGSNAEELSKRKNKQEEETWGNVEIGKLLEDMQAKFKTIEHLLALRS